MMQSFSLSPSSSSSSSSCYALQLLKLTLVVVWTSTGSSSSVVESFDLKQGSVTHPSSPRLLLPPQHYHQQVHNVDVDASSSSSSSSSSTGRRSFLTQCIVASTTTVLAATTTTFLQPIKVANAAYGDAPSIELPSYIDFLIEKNQAGKVSDTNQILYQGGDSKIQLERLKKSIVKLQEIPDIAHNKQWTSITGILTGPLGEMMATLRQLRTIVSTPNTSKDEQIIKITKQIQMDLYMIGTAASKKSEQGCIDGTIAALKDLDIYLKLVAL